MNMLQQVVSAFAGADIQRPPCRAGIFGRVEVGQPGQKHVGRVPDGLMESGRELVYWVMVALRADLRQVEGTRF
jgi:hypothetical protein